MIAGVVLASRGGSTEEVGAEPAIPLEIGQEESGELSGDDTAVFEVTAAEQPLIVEFRPFGFNGVLEVSPLGAAGSSHIQDAGFLGHRSSPSLAPAAALPNRAEWIRSRRVRTGCSCRQRASDLHPRTDPGHAPGVDR